MAEYRVDELARVAGTTVGNVRVYQDRELLPPPERRGRVALYSEAHLARLRMILGLLKRGYTFAQIRELLTTWESGRDLEHLLGLEQVLAAPWSDEATERLPITDLLAEFSGHEVGPSTVARLVRLGVFDLDGGTHVVVKSPRLLHTGRELLAAGVPLPVLLEIAEEVQSHTDELATLFLHLVDQHVVPGRDTGWTPSSEEMPELTQRASTLRPLAQAAVTAFLARSMSRALSDWLAERFGPLLSQHYPEQR
ncbi:MerR family transcriptional regulator [Prauserella cavernicola]|uniref:MerR family transcriptional regulator n=1 Tax=Prauserella cavernicola TaxID=2800127 RepID=A0A934QR80_9PSEU|nr:MerR family transcriptional regulator [Prauserella cavernicola]MBK1784757.1 MerR family transcriptional regulator [Prauserella cavernicola]